MIESNAEEVAAQFDRAGVNAREQAKFRLAGWGAKLRGEIATRAPGANYPGSIKLSGPRSFGSRVQVEVSSDRPDAWRKEKGLHRPDSRGRNYTAPGLQHDGQPHFAPAADSIAAAFYSDMEEIGADALE